MKPFGQSPAGLRLFPGQPQRQETETGRKHQHAADVKMGRPGKLTERESLEKKITNCGGDCWRRGGGVLGPVKCFTIYADRKKEKNVDWIYVSQLLAKWDPSLFYAFTGTRCNTSCWNRYT